MNTRFLNPGERKRLIAFLRERFGVESVNYMFIETGREKIRAFSGTLSREEIVRLGMFSRVELVGLYFARNDPVGGMRLSFDGLHAVQHAITSHTVELTESEFAEWMSGKHLDRVLEKGMYVMTHEGDFVGCGYSNGTRLFNYVPKERYLRLSD